MSNRSTIHQDNFTPNQLISDSSGPIIVAQPATRGSYEHMIRTDRVLTRMARTCPDTIALPHAIRPGRAWYYDRIIRSLCAAAGLSTNRRDGKNTNCLTLERVYVCVLLRDRIMQLCLLERASHGELHSTFGLTEIDAHTKNKFCAALHFTIFGLHVFTCDRGVIERRSCSNMFTHTHTHALAICNWQPNR